MYRSTAVQPNPISFEQLAKTLAWIAGGISLFSLGFFIDAFKVKDAVLGVFGLFGLAIILMPYRYGIFTLFLYLGVEGMAKLLSAYNPVVHVGADILIICLTIRFFLLQPSPLSICSQFSTV